MHLIPSCFFLISHYINFRSAGPVSYGFSSLEQNPSMLKSIASPDEYPYPTGHNPSNVMSPSAVNLQEEMTMEEAMDGSEIPGDSSAQNGTEGIS